MEGNPVNRIDPSGHWFCTGKNDCHEWIENALGNLKKLDPKIVSDFEQYDKNLTMTQLFTQLSSKDIFSLLDDNGCAIVAGGFQFRWTKLSDFGMVTRSTHIDINDRFYNNPHEPTAVAVLGHEFFHLLRQPFLVATTIYGELFAAQYEASLVLLQGVPLPAKLKPKDYDPVKGVLAMNPNYGPDLVAYREFTNVYPWIEPLYPPGVSITWPAQPDCQQILPNQPPACLAPTAPWPTVPPSTPQP